MEALFAIAIFVIIVLLLKHTSQNKKISEVREDFSNEKKNIERALTWKLVVEPYC